MPTDTELAALYARVDKYLAMSRAALQRSIHAMSDDAADDLFHRITSDAQRMGTERANKILAGAMPRKDSAFSPALTAPGCRC